MTPAMPSASCAFSAAMSASDETPPDAITGIETWRAKSATASRVDPGKRPVARDVGVDDRRHAAILEAAGELDDPDLRRLAQPSTATRPSRASMPTTIAPGMIGGGAAHQLRVAQRGGAEHDAVDAERQPAFDRVAVADAAAELDPQIDRVADRLDRLAIDRAAGKGAVEVDDMQPGKAGFGKAPRLRGGIARRTPWRSPYRRGRSRTQAPSFRSIAGNRITAPPARPRGACSNNGRARSGHRPARKPGGCPSAGSRGSRRARSPRAGCRADRD